MLTWLEAISCDELIYLSSSSMTGFWIEGGSKAVPSNGATSHGRSIEMMPFQLVTLFLFMASYASISISFWVFFESYGASITIWTILCVILPVLYTVFFKFLCKGLFHSCMNELYCVLCFLNSLSCKIWFTCLIMSKSFVKLFWGFTS